jgi:hypothetical protein
MKICYQDGARPELFQLHLCVFLYIVFVLFYVLFVFCRSVYCLCVNVYCITATGCQRNFTQQVCINNICTS